MHENILENLPLGALFSVTVPFKQYQNTSLCGTAGTLGNLVVKIKFAVAQQPVGNSTLLIKANHKVCLKQRKRRLNRFSFNSY